MKIQRDVSLSDHVTLRLGGCALRLVVADGADDVRRALEWARERDLPVALLGGGSNVVPSDRGWPGLVLKLGDRTVSFRPEGEDVRTARRVIVEAGAGLRWDRLVEMTVRRGLEGIERLSGIPGTVGAAPVQNIGAYGQEIADTLVSIDVLDRWSLEEKSLTAAACDFGYRRSRFNREERDRFVILRVRLGLRPALPDRTEATAAMSSLRQETLAVRRGKGALLGSGPPSAGSFFRNPVLTDDAFRKVTTRWRTAGGVDSIPSYRTAGGTKVPAAWLVERSGFPRGTRRGAVGVSPHHALVLVHHGGGTVRALWRLADEIRNAVDERFGVALDVEPEILEAGRSEPGHRRPAGPAQTATAP